jgi:hypothetical protein
MTLTEAERRVKSNLYNLETNAAMLEHEELLLEMLREHGSRVEQRYDEKPGKVSARYVESVPPWFLAIEDTQRVVWELIDAVTETQGMLKFYQDQEPKIYEFYKAKYQAKRPIPELKKRYGTGMKTLDRDLVYNLIRWHGWSIDEEGGGEFWRWERKRSA